MFTGLIESIGTIKKITPKGNYLVLAVSHNFMNKDIKAGDSISCDGACLTVVSQTKSEFTFELSQETINKTIVGNYVEGAEINLERAVRVGDRLGGHFVTGHVDTIAVIRERKKIGESVVFEIKYDNKFDNLIVPKGSVAINGVSLTVNDSSPGIFSVNLIPHTLEHTTLKRLEKNDTVNIEFDLVGKYAVKSIAGKQESTITHSKLIESGW